MFCIKKKKKTLQSQSVIARTYVYIYIYIYMADLFYKSKISLDQRTSHEKSKLQFLEVRKCLS